MQSIRRLTRALPALALVLAFAGCTTKQVGTRTPNSTLGASLVVEKFLEAANAKDLPTMARLFGTADGSILKRESEESVEQRMYLIADILKHEDYKFVGEGIVPGRSSEARRLLVSLTIGGRAFTVPFTMVRSKQDWLVEQVDLQAITSARGAR